MKTSTELFLLTMVQLILVSAFIAVFSTQGGSIAPYVREDDPLYRQLASIFASSMPNSNGGQYYTTTTITVWDPAKGNVPEAFTTITGTAIPPPEGAASYDFSLWGILVSIWNIIIFIPLLIVFLIRMIGVSCAAVWAIPFVGPPICLYWVGTIVLWGISSLPTMSKS